MFSEAEKEERFQKVAQSNMVKSIEPILIEIQKISTSNTNFLQQENKKISKSLDDLKTKLRTMGANMEGDIVRTLQVLITDTQVTSDMSLYRSAQLSSEKLFAATNGAISAVRIGIGGMIGFKVMFSFCSSPNLYSCTTVVLLTHRNSFLKL